MMEKYNDNFKEKASKIQYFFTDVDGTLTDGSVYYSSEGEELKKFSLRDGTGHFLLQQCGIKTGIITGEDSPIVFKRAEKLKVDVLLTNAVPKLKTLQRFINEKGLCWDNIAYIGDDLNDVNLLKQCGLSFSVKDANLYTKKAADIVCSACGGYGAFREAAEILLTLREVNIENIINFLL